MSFASRFYNNIPFIMEGQVVDTNDPDQMGRCRVWVPALDGDSFDVETLPWTEYASPFGGFTVKYGAGSGPAKNNGDAAYGFWAIPKIGSTVLVFCLGGDPARRFYFASTLRLHRNRSLPAGRNVDFNNNTGPRGDSGDDKGNLEPIQPAFNNLKAQFNNQTLAPQAQSRGAWERAVAQAGQKDGTDGYAASTVTGPQYLDPQTYCWVTPGHHAIIMQDNPTNGRVRVKTAEGHQIILDDANERIYVSTSKGKTWIEMDVDGHVHVFGSESVSVRSGKDINLYADNDINMEAGHAVNVKALGGDVRINTAASFHLTATKDIVEQACGGFDMSSGKGMKLTSGESFHLLSKQSVLATATGGFDIKAGGSLKQSAARIDLNGPAARTASEAKCAEQPVSPSVVPGHEPWVRPNPAVTRGTNWKP